MTRIRVHELAKELNVSNKDLLDRIARLGIQVKNHMSTLSDLAVQRIRQHLIGSKAEEVEQKRIGRTVIRRRKRTSMEEIVPGQEAEGFVQAAPEGEIPVRVGLSEPAVAVEEEDLHFAPSQAVAEAEAEVAVEAPQAPREFPEEVASEEPSMKEVARKSREATAEVEAPVMHPEPAIEGFIAEEVQPQEVGPAETIEPEAAVEEPAPFVPPREEEPPRKLEAEQPVVVEAEHEVPAAPIEEVVETKAKPIAAVEAHIEAPEQAGPAAPEGSPVEEEAEKPKKAKKRRRKKSHRDEPARIISLPEIIPEEAEEEPEILAVVPPRLQVVTEEVEGRDIARKKRPKHEEFQKEAPGRKWRGPGRREVVEREDLYTKKELAAQADRVRDRDKFERGAAAREAARPEPVIPKVGRRKIRIDEAITIANLAKSMGIKAGEVIKKLLILGLPANINQAVDFDTASLIASEFDFEVEKVGFEEEDVLQTQQQDRPEDLQPRPPVVTVMGHVDHGKTSLLDAIRHTNVIGGEAGGITQHIGAYYVKLESGDVVFLDTPGHEAFTAMRARGSKVTDIVILVVAADDGVMQQTIEAINHSKAAGVPIVVAINKIDKPNANIDRVKRELAEQGLLPEEWGGDTTMVEVSAKKNVGIEELLEMVLLQAEMMELKANPNKPARGRVIEAKLDRGRGPVASILIQEGTLKTGDAYVCGVQYGRVRNMFNDRGQRLETAGPSTPVEVLGLSGVPNAGDDFTAVADERHAKMVAEHRLLKVREKELSKTSKVTLESLFEQIQEGEVKELNVILKTDVQGSLEAISDSLVKLSTPEVKVNLIHSTTGAITETDVMLASASNAIVIGFNVRADAKVQELAEQEQVDVRYYDVIYQIISDVKDAMVGMLEPIYKENVIGRAEVRKVFHVPKIGMIAGCYVLDGRVERGSRARVLREQVVIYDGKIVSLKRYKDDIKEAKAGFECGINIEHFNDVKVDDIIEAYEIQEIKPTLETTENARE